MLHNAYLSTIYNSQNIETWPKDKQIKKMWYMVTMEYYLALYKDGAWPFTAKWGDSKVIMYSKASQG